MPREAYYGASGGLDHLKSFLKWRSDAEEAAWEAETGWNLLTLACAMDDAAAVDTLLAQDPATVKTLLEAKGESRDPWHQQEGAPCGASRWARNCCSTLWI